MTPVFAIDFETFYTKEYSLKELSVWSYVHDSRFDAYLVAVHSDDFHWVGNPKKFDWSTLKGALLVAHNVGFDGLVFKRLQELGVIPMDVVPSGWFDTADMAAYFRCVRTLDNVAKTFYSKKLDKSMRSKMEGLTWDMAVAAGYEERLVKYGGEDAEVTYQFWKDRHAEWPFEEQELSRLNREACWRGLPIDVPYVEACIESLRKQKHALELAIPWHEDPKYKDTLLSPVAMREYARLAGLTDMPASMDKRLKEAIEWENKHSEKYPWIRAVRDYRSLNILLGRFETILQDTREDGTFPYSLKYFGTGTGRFSGGTEKEVSSGRKFNVQNMPKEEMFGCDLRKAIRAPKGKKLVITDYSQIEARLVVWRAGDKALLSDIRSGLNIYEANAKKILGLVDVIGLKRREPKTYAMVKALTLGCGFQMGGGRFKESAPALTGGAYTPTIEEAVAGVAKYREMNPLVVQYWWKHDNWLTFSCNAMDDVHEVVLKSGRVLTYYEPRWHAVENGRKEKKAYVWRGSTKKEKLYGGKLTENEIQATARDLLRDAWLALDKAGHTVLLTVHDEFLNFVDEGTADKDAEEINKIVTSSSPWAEGCPLETEQHIVDVYEK